MFQLIVDTTNKYILEKEYRSRVAMTNMLELINFFRIRLRMLLNKSPQKKKFEDYYKDSNIREKDWMPLHRFRILHSRSRADIDIMAKLLRQQTYRTFLPSQVFAIDELLVSFKSHKAKLIVVNMNKPHTKGYLIYIMSALSKRCGLPIMFDVAPITKHNQLSLHTQVKQFAQRLLLHFNTLRNRVHFVTDSAFGSVDIVQVLRTMGVFMTTSMKKSYNRKIWDVMSYNMKGYSNGRTLYNRSNGMVYNMIIHTKDLHVLSSSFEKKQRTLRRWPVSNSMITEILRLKEKLMDSYRERLRLLQLISSSQLQNSRSFTSILSSVSISTKKLNRDDNKLLNQLDRVTSSITTSGNIKKVLRCINMANNRYEVQLDNGQVKVVSSNELIGYNGHVIPAFLQFASREHLKAHFEMQSLATLKRISAHLGCGRGM